MTAPTLPTGRRLRFQPGVALALLMGGAIATIALARWTAAPPAPVASEPVSRLRALHFVDLPDGAVSVIDAGSDEAIARFEGEQGFLRGTLRALARERRLHGLDAKQPLELIAHPDGRLSLHDPATGMRIALESFGSSNAGVYARLLQAP